MKELLMQFLDDVSVRQRGITDVPNSPWGRTAAAVWVWLEQGARRALGLLPRLWTLLPSGQRPPHLATHMALEASGSRSACLNYTCEKRVLLSNPLRQTPERGTSLPVPLLACRQCGLQAQHGGGRTHWPCRAGSESAGPPPASPGAPLRGFAVGSVPFGTRAELS